jgi:hypothetical protein
MHRHVGKKTNAVQVMELMFINVCVFLKQEEEKNNEFVVERV